MHLACDLDLGQLDNNCSKLIDCGLLNLKASYMINKKYVLEVQLHLCCGVQSRLCILIFSTSFSIQADLQGQLFCARLLMDLINKWMCGIAVANASYPFHTLPKHYNIVDEIVPIDKSAMSIVGKICLIPPQDIHLMFLVPYPCEQNLSIYYKRY